MLINPILVAIAAVVLGFGLAYCLINRPRIPILTLLFLVILICFLFFTLLLNSILESSAPSDPQFGRLVTFLVGKSHPTQEQCAQAFQCYQIADIVLFVGTLLSMGVDIWRIVVKPSFNKK